jgi:hypothetical protein
MPTRATAFLSSIIILLLFAVGGSVFLSQKTPTPPSPTPSIAVPQVAPESNPESGDGARIRLTSLVEGDTLTPPITIHGEARGTWFFEGSFPVELRDESYEIITQGIATSTEDWMTESFIPFAVTLNWASTTATSATLILIKDNPSGLPEHDDRHLVEVLLKQTTVQ